MGTAQLVLEYIKVLAWPVVGIFLLFFFRKQLSQMVSRIASSAKELDVSVGSNSLKLKIIDDAIHEAIEESVNKAAKVDAQEEIKQIVNNEANKVVTIANLSPLAIDIILLLGTGLEGKRDERNIQVLIQERYTLPRRPVDIVSQTLQELEMKHLIRHDGVVAGISYPPPLKYALTSEGMNIYHEIKKSIESGSS